MRPTPHPRLASLALLLLVGLLAAACAKVPSARTCASHGECPSGTTCQVGICQEGLALELAAPADQAVTRATVLVSVTVAGEAPAAVQLLVDDQEVALLSPPFQHTLDTASLAEGSHTLAARADVGGRSFRSPSRTLIVDRTAPAAPTVTAGATNTPNPVTVSGTAEPGTTVTVHEGSAVLGTGVAGAGGAWSAGLTLSEGPHGLRVTAADAAGNVSSSSATVTLVVDRTAPAAPTVNAGTTNAANPVPITGSAEAGSRVTVYEAGLPIASGIVAAAGGTWSTSAPFTQGLHGLTATATDAAGNVSAASAETIVVVDRTAPVAPTVAPLVTRAADPVTVSGTAEAGASVTVYEGGAPLGPVVTAAAGGGWSTAVALAEGTHAITATATDAAGNVSALSAPGAVVVDRTAPPPPAVAAQITRAANPVTVGGTAEPGSTVALYEGATPLAPSVVAAGGTWSAAVTLAEGTHALTATATDEAGNVSALSAAADVVVDRTPPSVALPTVPGDGATGVWSRSPIVVTFSEAILASTLTTQSVTVRAGGVDLVLGAPAASSLSPDGRTLTLTPDPAVLPAVPSTVQATLSSAITDVAGNPLATTTWTWSLPGWVAPAPALITGADGSSPFTSALGPDASIRVACSRSPPRQLATWTTSAGAWVFGGDPDPSGLSGITDYALGVDSTGRATVAFVSGGQVRVSQQSGASWTNLSTSLNADAANTASGVRVAVDSQDRPVVVWAEAGAVRAKRWDGAAWSSVGTAIAFASGVYALAIAPGDAVGIAVANGVYLDGTARPGYVIDTSTEVSLAFDGAGTPFAAYVPSGTTTVQVVQPGNPPASWYAPLGGAMGTTASGPALVYRASGAAGQQLVVGYYEASGTASVQVLGWNGTAWSSIASDIGTPSSAFYRPMQLVVNGAGVVALSWSETRYPAAQLVPRLYNR